MDNEKRIQDLSIRLNYIEDIFGGKDNQNIAVMRSKLMEYGDNSARLSDQDNSAALDAMEDLFSFLEKKLDAELTAMDKVRIVRHPQRICLKDILENVYDQYTEIGGQDEWSLDPSMVIARASITRKIGSKVINQPVMVIGQEKGHGQDFRNGGSVKPWGNAKALHYMRVAETENIPIHTYVFTPGAYPVEDYPGAAQQIARNLYEMAALSVPIISVISEGGSGGAEAIALADYRMMLSHGYYSVISPEGAAAIEGGLKHKDKDSRAGAVLIEKCAHNLKITAEDNFKSGLIDKIIQEPLLGARPDHFDFFKELRREMILATDRIALSVRGGIKFFRSRMIRKATSNEEISVRWSLNEIERERLLWRRYQKYRKMSQGAYVDRRSLGQKAYLLAYDLGWSVYSFLRYEFYKKHQQMLKGVVDEIEAEAQVVVGRIWAPFAGALEKVGTIFQKRDKHSALTTLSRWDEGKPGKGSERVYVSPRASQDMAVTCPNAAGQGCLDQWAPDLFRDGMGVCSYCGHHFNMEYEWYLFNIFDRGSIYEFNEEIESGNPLQYEGFNLKIEEARKKTRHKSSCMTFEARVNGIKIVVAMFIAGFRGGSVGAAEGEKFVRAADRARNKHLPFLAYVHGTAGIRIQEGTFGVIQMPRCTLAVRRYIDAGGLYLVIYDTNSYAGPVASFLGSSPYQYSIRSANIGFAGPGVIRETTGMDIPPDYHRSHRALSRGHIQGIWDRRELKRNLHQSLTIMGGHNLYYR